MIVKTNKLIGEFLCKSAYDNIDIRRISKSDLEKLELGQYKLLPKLTHTLIPTIDLNGKVNEVKHWHKKYETNDLEIQTLNKLYK